MQNIEEINKDLQIIGETVKEVFVDLFVDLSEEDRRKILLGIEEDIKKSVKVDSEDLNRKMI